MSTSVASEQSAKQIEGRVVSVKMNKTIVVVQDWQKPHPKYGKVMRHQTRYYAHDDKNECEVGDWVVLASSRPLSKLKRWVLASIKEKVVKV